MSLYRPDRKPRLLVRWWGPSQVYICYIGNVCPSQPIDPRKRIVGIVVLGLLYFLYSLYRKLKLFVMSCARVGSWTNSIRVCSQYPTHEDDTVRPALSAGTPSPHPWTAVSLRSTWNISQVFVIIFLLRPPARRRGRCISPCLVRSHASEDLA